MSPHLPLLGYSRSASHLRRVSINALEGTLTSSSIIGPPSIRRIKPFMSFEDQPPSLQHAIMGASVKWVIPIGAAA